MASVSGRTSAWATDRVSRLAPDAGLGQDEPVADPITFSVVIPLYNKRDQILATLGSVLGQTLAPVEVIVVDDGSTDGGPDVVASLADHRVRIVHQRNAGPGAARNRGFAEASAAWVALIDADDLWLPGHLATLARVAEAFPDADAVGSGWREVGPGCDPGLEGPASLDDRRWMIDYFREGHSGLFQASSIAIRRAPFLLTAGFGASRLGEDSEFWVRFALDHAIAVSDRKTSLYVRGAGGIMERAQAAMASGGSLDPQPLFATLDAALASPRLTAKRDAIQAYSDRVRLQYARSLIYHGRGREARALLAGVRQPSRPLSAYRLLSRMPASVLRFAAGVFSRGKRLFGPRS